MIKEIVASLIVILLILLLAISGSIYEDYENSKRWSEIFKEINRDD